MSNEMRSEPLHSFTDHGWQVSTTKFSICSKYVATGSWDKSVVVYDVIGLQAMFRIPSAHALPITGLQWLKNNNLVTTSADRTICVWDTSTGQRKHQFSGHSGWVMACDTTNDNITSASWDNTLALWDLNRSSPVCVMSGHVAGVWSCAGLNHSQVIASSSEDCTLRLWDSKTGTSFATLAGGHNDSVLSVCWPSNEYILASSSTDTNIVLWDTRTCKTLAQIPAHTDSVKQLTTVPHTPGLIASVGDSSLKTWDVRDSNDVKMLGCRTFNTDIECVSVSSDTLTHICGGVNATAYLSLFVGVNSELYLKYKDRYKERLDVLKEERSTMTHSRCSQPTKPVPIPPQYIPRTEETVSLCSLPLSPSESCKRESSCSDSGVDVGS